MNMYFGIDCKERKNFAFYGRILPQIDSFIDYKR